MSKINIIDLHQIPEIFHGYNSLATTSLEIIDESKDTWTDFICHLSKFNDLSAVATQNQIKNIILDKKFKDEPIIQAGLAKCYIAEGRFIDAIKILGYTFSLFNKVNPDIQAYILLEMINLLSVIGSRDHAIHLLKAGKLVSQSKYISRLYNYYELVNKIRKGDYKSINSLISSAKYFEKNNQFTTLAFHYKNIGNAFGMIRDIDNEISYYNKALSVCDENNYGYIRSAVNHDLAMSLFKSGNKEKALKKLNKTANSAKSFYTQAYTLGNIGFIYFKEKKYQSCFKYFEKSLDIAKKNGVFHLLPSMCYYLGKSKQAESDISAASVYFKKGYEASMEMTKLKFPIKGERLMVIDEYVKIINLEVLESKGNSFNFAIDKTLEEIRGVFKNTLLKFLFDQENSVAEVVKKLKMSASSYSKIKNRYKKYNNEDLLYNPEVINFIKKYSDLDWKHLNIHFETEMLRYLYKHYKYNKKVLSKKLNINYSSLVTKFRKIKDTDDK